MEVFWTDIAFDHLESIHQYISQGSVDYAQRVVDRITNRSKQISNFPESGRVVPEISIKQIREVIEGPYRIIYYIKSDQIDILAVIHGAQKFNWQ